MENYYSLTMDSLRTYILGGSVEFVLSEKDNEDNHITFHVKRDSKDEALYWVRYKSIDWIYIGRIVVTDKVLFHPLKLDVKTPDETIIKADLFRKFILFVYHLEKIPSNINVLYTGKCGICNRKLTNPTYIRIGIGPDCLKKLDT